jgi:regulator of replication initiation timing
MERKDKEKVQRTYREMERKKWREDEIVEENGRGEVENEQGRERER